MNDGWRASNRWTLQASSILLGEELLAPRSEEKMGIE
jgi:hypothetical protein